ncbi:MAG: hypothetical protein U1D66_06580, partial [Erythrobacter sp.]|nr:hypothetical protein [Erythrobacter sp.]
DWAASWAADKLQSDSDVTAAEIVSAGVLRIDRKEYGPFIAAILGEKQSVSNVDIESFAGSEVKINFFANITRDAIWTGGAINAARAWPAGHGGFADLGRAIRNEPDVTRYRNKELAFFEDGFVQHTAVRSVERVYDRKFRLERFGKPDFVVVLIDAYDMSAEDIRSAYSRYGHFDGALKMSSYGSVTSQAKDAAALFGAGAYKWGELLGRLNRA